MVGKKVDNVDDAKGVGTTSSSERVEYVSSFEGGGRKNLRKPPDILRMRRGRTLFDWGAFNLELHERSRVDDPP